ncbi:proline-rich protein 3 [Rhodamnia argentea]|uniref:Proline-rich protein 3 n=1 Tax=Rhodamnia argentea TaxID=178133 RepID=A0A8B8PHX5_9MYRT|nr:proline-rich protein 3 [Rhodamnia argentea]
MAMAVLIAASLVAMMGGSGLVLAWEDSKVIHVGGRVLCQDCTKGYDEWVKGGSPIKGAKVSLTCMDQRHRVIFYGSDDADGAGQFNMVVNRHINGKRLDGKLCSVRLVSSPDPDCNVATDFASGRRGVKLSRPTSVYREVIKYSVGPLYYTSPMCEEPEME